MSDQAVTLALAATRQPVDHPLRRLRPGVDVAHDPAGETTAQVGSLNLDLQPVVVRGSDGRKIGCMSGAP